MQQKLNRRNFIKLSSIAGTGLILGCTSKSPKLLSINDVNKNELGLWVRIGDDESITLVVPSVEMGQHIHTGQAMLLAEELEVNWDSINVLMAPVNPEYGNPFLFNRQRTDGNYSISSFWIKLRKIGAGVKFMLISVASKRFGGSMNDYYAENGKIFSRITGKSITYGKLALEASKLTPPSDPPLKTNDQFKFIGKSIPKIHIPSKSNGKAIFGTDIRRPEMLYAAVCQSPVFGGKVKSYDEKAAMSSKGAKAIIQIPNGIAFVADSTWHAFEGIKLLKPIFEGGKTNGLNSEKIRSKFKSALNEIGKAKINSNLVLDVEYEVPLLYHATMEPMNCTASVTENSCDVWVPTMEISLAHEIAMEITGLSKDQVNIHVTLLGGGFGRRLINDYVVQAVTISKELKKTVQVIWTREEDIQHSYYRIPGMSRFQIGLNKNGIPEKWESQSAQPNFFSKFARKNMKLPGITSILDSIGFDPMAVPGKIHDYPILPKHFYNISGVNVSNISVDLGIPIGPWRQPPNTVNVFYTESVIDELANLAKIDPLEYRLMMLDKKPNYKKVIDQLAIQSKWGSPLPKNYGRGIAINDWIGLDDKERITIVAVVVEVHISERGKLKVTKIDSVVDCGIVVNPDAVISQIEGTCIMAMSSALFEKISINKGRVEQSNFDDYRIARMKHTPKIKVTTIESDRAPTGVGESGTAPVIPAITNAIFAATGKRIRKLPIGKQKLI